MATSIPRHSGPSHGAPTSPLPALPKTRKSNGLVPTASSLKAGGMGRSGLRAPSTSSLPSTPGGSSPALPKLRTTPSVLGRPPGVNSAGKTIRKTISINAFPQPPRGVINVRTSSLPPSPLSGLTPSSADSRRESSDSPVTPKSGAKKSKTSNSPSSTNMRSYTIGASPSLLNGSGDSKSISSGPGARGSDGLLSLPSPPQSRSSSAQDSYSTSGTLYTANFKLQSINGTCRVMLSSIAFRLSR